jgi:hypothetical protein
MNFLQAQENLAESIIKAGRGVSPYFWRLSGDAANSLNRILGVAEEDLKVILRLCNIYTGENDNFSKKNFDLLITKSGCDWTTYRLNGKVERFLKIGDKGDRAALPKEMFANFDADSLVLHPVQDVHFLRRHNTRAANDSILPELVHFGNKKMEEKMRAATTAADDDFLEKKRQQLTILPEELLLEFINECIVQAATTGNAKMSTRSTRAYHRLFPRIVTMAAQDLLKAAFSKYGGGTIEEKQGIQKESTTSTLVFPPRPDEVVSISEEAGCAGGGAVLVTPAPSLAKTTHCPTTFRQEDNDDIVEVLFDNNKNDGREDNELVQGEQELIAASTTTNEFLADLKDEVVLQMLLHKRIHDKKERVFGLEHRNGRRLLVVLPPDVQSASSFEEEANKTNWVGVMLNTEERVEGMLLHLAKTHPDTFVRVGRNRKLTTKTVSLDTVQTLALARVGRLNDGRLKKVKSFLKTMGNVNLQMTIPEQQRIDVQVGLHRTNDAIFGKRLHEWSKTKGKEKRAPELVHFWNSQLSNEIEAEVDLYLRHLFMTGMVPADTIPSIDYVADGFPQPGVTLLFGGDHGDKHCPISCKLNLSPPAVRKEKRALSYQCPVVCFASIECSTDSYGLLNSTVMPAVRKELKALESSSVVTVFDVQHPTTKFRSYVVPSSIRSIGIIQEAVELNNNQPLVATMKIKMTFGFDAEKVGDPPQFGSICIDDPVFIDVKYYDLRTKVTVTTFHHLFIGDLAFLAMVIGMTNSSGAHCLMCTKTKNQFNCNHFSDLKLRTKEELVANLEQYMLEVAKPGKSPANYLGVNGPGLLDIDPQRIIIPILHCPMGLVDKVLESFKVWVNFSVENYGGNEALETSRIVFSLAKEHHAAAFAQDAASQLHAKNHPGNKELKENAEQTNKERIKAKKAESKAKEGYEELVQRHNAKKDSLNQQFEVIFRRNGIKREVFHGGKFNGVNCIRVMEKSKALFLGKEEEGVVNDPLHAGFLQKCLLAKTETTTDEEIIAKCNDYCRLLGLLDTIWSAVRGLDAGLLPSNEQKIILAEALSNAKALWLQMGLSTQQPKWHLTFDGHLLHQVTLYGGLADKSDETIEKGHQTLKRLRERFRGIYSYERRENCIRRELRRSRSPEIQLAIEMYETKIKHSVRTKRSLDTTERQEYNKRVKKEKRDAYVVTI